MTVPPILNIACGEFLEDWRLALAHMTDDEQRDYVLHVKQKMTEVAFLHRSKP